MWIHGKIVFRAKWTAITKTYMQTCQVFCRKGQKITWMWQRKQGEQQEMRSGRQWEITARSVLQSIVSTFASTPNKMGRHKKCWTKESHHLIWQDISGFYIENRLQRVGVKAWRSARRQLAITQKRLDSLESGWQKCMWPKFGYSFKDKCNRVSNKLDEDHERNKSKRTPQFFHLNNWKDVFPIGWNGNTESRVSLEDDHKSSCNMLSLRCCPHICKEALRRLCESGVRSCFLGRRYRSELWGYKWYLKPWDWMI